MVGGGAVAMLQTVLGLEPDVPAGELGLRPLPGGPLGAVSVQGLRIAGRPVDVAVGATGEAVVEGLPEGLRIVHRLPLAADPAGAAASSPGPLATSSGRSRP